VGFEVVTRADFSCSQRGIWTNVYRGCYECYDLKNWTTDGQPQIRILKFEIDEFDARTFLGQAATTSTRVVGKNVLLRIGPDSSR
jgi:hypothetical protein